MKTLVIGLGNPILGDDGVGWCIAWQVKERLASQPPPEAGAPEFEVDCLSVGGLSLMERLVGYDHAILVDAITTGQAEDGTVFCFSLDDLPPFVGGHLSSAHDTTLQNAIQVGRSMGAHLPSKVSVIAVESQNVFEFSEELSPPVAGAVPQAVQMVLDVIQMEETKL